MKALQMGLLAAMASLAAGCSSESPPPAAAVTAPAEQAWINPFPNADAPGAQADSPQELANKQVVLEFYDKAFNAKDFAAASQFLGAQYVEHSPTIADGAAGLEASIQALKTEHPESRNEVKRVITDGDHVIVHAHAVRKPGDVGSIAGSIYRLENGKIVEHWGILHALPEKAHPDNPNQAF